MERLIPISEAHQDLDVIVLGRAGMDLYPSPPGTKTADALKFTSDLGGSAGNIAVALVRHGLKVGLIAPVSNDPAGHFVKNNLNHYGVEHLTPEPVSGSARTSLALAESRSEDCEVVIYRNEAADFQITDQIIEQAQIARAPVLVVTGTALAQEPSRSATLAAMKAATFVVLDLDYRAYSWKDDKDTRETYRTACELSNIIIGNDEEFDMLDPGQGKQCAESYAVSSAMVIYKMGALGSSTFIGDQSFSTGIFNVKMLKPFGAGDAFMGGIIAALFRDKSAQTAVEFGSAAAAIVVSTLGCASAMPTSQQVADFIASHKG